MENKNIIVCGSRNLTDYNAFKKKLDELFTINLDHLTIYSGNAKGPDSFAIKYAEEKNINVKIFPADWNKYGKIAGFVRNSEMLQDADGVIAFWDMESKGTAHMIKIAKNKPVKVLIINTRGF